MGAYALFAPNSQQPKYLPPRDKCTNSQRLFWCLADTPGRLRERYVSSLLCGSLESCVRGVKNAPTREWRMKKKKKDSSVFRARFSFVVPSIDALIERAPTFFFVLNLSPLPHRMLSLRGVGPQKKETAARSKRGKSNVFGGVWNVGEGTNETTYIKTVCPEKMSSVHASTVPGIICSATINMSQKPVLSEGTHSSLGVGSVVTDRVKDRYTLSVPITHRMRRSTIARAVQVGEIRPMPMTVKTTEVMTKKLAGPMSTRAGITSKPRSRSSTLVYPVSTQRWSESWLQKAIPMQTKQK